MRIEQRDTDRRPAAETRGDAAAVLQADINRIPVCAADCPDAQPGQCSRRCPKIPEVLSTDPDRHPIEPRIAPLTFELKRLGVFHPCWSCEGHNDPQGRLWKVPRVWFYCNSVVHVRVLSDAVRHLHTQRRLIAPWRVTLTHTTPDNPDTAFSLEPDIDNRDVGLVALQKDVDTLAEQLQHTVHIEARSLSQSVT